MLATDSENETRTHVITVRLPWNEHEALKILAHQSRISLNTLCRAALKHVLQHADPIADEQLVGFKLNVPEAGWLAQRGARPRLRFVSPTPYDGQSDVASASVVPAGHGVNEPSSQGERGMLAG